MKFLKFALHKRYFDTGYGTLNYPTKALMVLGIGWNIQGDNLKWTIIFTMIYSIFAYFLGWWWLNYGMLDAETEISNRYNPFVDEVREKFKISKYAKPLNT